MQNFFVISWAYFKLEHSKFLSNWIEILLVGQAPARSVVSVMVATHLYAGMRLKLSKKSRNLWSCYNFTIFLFKMWMLCIICDDFRSFHALKKSGNQENTLENSYACLYISPWVYCHTPQPGRALLDANIIGPVLAWFWHIAALS